MSSPTLSVALATYNGGRYLRRQIDSILDQTREPDEIVICDDASQDGTVLIAREYAEEYPELVEVHEFDENAGAFANFERTFRRCSGDYIAVADQDDEWVPEKLERQMSALTSTPGSVVSFHDSAVCDEQLVPDGTTLWERRGIDPTTCRRQQLCVELAHRNFVQGASMLFHRDILDITLPLPEHVPYDHWIVLVGLCVGPAAVVDDALLRWRRHDSTDTPDPKPNTGGEPGLVHRYLVEGYNLVRTPRRERHEKRVALAKRMYEFCDRFESLEDDRLAVDRGPIRESLSLRRTYFEAVAGLRDPTISLVDRLKLFRYAASISLSGPHGSHRHFLVDLYDITAREVLGNRFELAIRA